MGIKVDKRQQPIPNSVYADEVARSTRVIESHAIGRQEIKEAADPAVGTCQQCFQRGLERTVEHPQPVAAQIEQIVHWHYTLEGGFNALKDTLLRQCCHI